MKTYLLGATLFIYSTCAIGQEVKFDSRGWVVGAGIGTAFLSISPQKNSVRQPSHESPALLTVFGGYNFNNWFGLEFDVSRSSDIHNDDTGYDDHILGTSFATKFSHFINDRCSVYLKTGAQYIAYEKKIYSRYDEEYTLNDIEPFIGGGVQIGFDSGVRARLDYKYAEMNLDEFGGAFLDFDYYGEELDMTYSTLVFTLNYQF